LYNPDADALYEGVSELINDLAKRYTLVLVSLAKSDTPQGRRQKIQESGIAQYFKMILVGGEDKNEMYEKVLTDMKIKSEEVLIVDDRTVRGIAWGNRRGATTVWLRRGKFADELPTKETGNPTFTINDVTELKDYLS